MTAIYRADTISSLLRPAYLKDARQAWEAGVLPASEFKRLEDRAVDEAIALQDAAGLDVVSDGEMRRYLFTGVLTEAIDGLEQIPGASVHWHGQTPQEGMDFRLPSCVTGKLRRRRFLATEEFAYARGKAQKALKISLPSPMLLALYWSPEHSPAAYRDPFALFADAVDLLRQDIHELSSLGCEYIQIDAPELATLVDESIRRNVYEAIGISPARMLSEGIEMLNALADAPGVMFGLQMCRGNNQGRWLSQGGYEVIATQVFQGARHYDIFLLEYKNQSRGTG
jgi:methionine synthase II (cobalamin-independent)